MLYAGLDLSRMHLASGCSTREARRWMGLRCRPDADGLRGLAGRVACFAQPVRAASESMNCARFVHDQLEGHCCDVEIADALKPEDDMPSAAEHLVTRGARCGRLRLPVGEVRRRGRVDARSIRSSGRFEEAPDSHGQAEFGHAFARHVQPPESAGIRV